MPDDPVIAMTIGPEELRSLTRDLVRTEIAPLITQVLQAVLDTQDSLKMMGTAVEMLESRLRRLELALLPTEEELL